VLCIGPAGWAYKDWAGYVYPQPRPKNFHPATFLAEYFDTIEINTSFYHPMQADHVAQWIERVSGNPRFLFTAKLWKKFTHEHNATTADEREARAGLDVLHSGGRLGALLVQFPFSFHREAVTVEYLSRLLKRFSDYPLVVEVRHSSWNIPDTFELLREHDAGFCNIDQPIIGRSLKPSAQVTSPVGYVRFHGRRYDTWFSDDAQAAPSDRYDYLYPKEELEPWMERIGSIAKKSKTVFVITNNHPAAKSLQTGFLLATMFLRKKIKVPETMFERYPELIELAAEPPKEPRLF